MVDKINTMRIKAYIIAMII